MPLMGKQNGITNHLQEVAKKFLPTPPKAIVVISAHWESDPIKITSSSNPGLLYDYYGFPPETYEYKYPARGDPELSSKIKAQLQKQGLKSELDKKRGFDHGVFVPLMLMYPKADIPVVCVSLHQSLKPETNIAIGKALRPLREDGVLILGSGYTFHNMQSFFHPSDDSHKASRKFNEWLKKTIVEEGNLDALKDWAKAPGAKLCHPREEHLMPLLVIAGAATAEDGCEQAQVVYDNTSDGDHAVSSYLFGSK